jgi:hypothetical protein
MIAFIRCDNDDDDDDAILIGFDMYVMILSGLVEW